MENNDYTKEFINNFEQKCFCVLVLDVSSSMLGKPMEELNNGLQEFYNEISSDETTSQRLEISLITFNHKVQTIQEPTLVKNFTMPQLEANGSTDLINAVNAAIDKVAARKQWYDSIGQAYYRPWIILITDGELDSDQDVNNLAQRIKKDTSNKQYSFLPIGVDGANMQVLDAIKGNIPPMKLKEAKFSTFFKWLSASMDTICSEDTTSYSASSDWMECFSIDGDSYGSIEENTDLDDECLMDNDTIEAAIPIHSVDTVSMSDDMENGCRTMGTETWMDAFEIGRKRYYDSEVVVCPPQTATNDKHSPSIECDWISKPAKVSLLSRLFKKRTDDVYSSIFSPAEVKPKSHLLVQVFLHLYEETEKVKVLAQESQREAERRDYIPLLCKLKKGDKVDIHLNIYGETLLMSDKKSVIWQGSFTKCSFDYFVSKYTGVDELSCMVQLTINGVPIGEMRFITKIVNEPRQLNPEVIVRKYNKVFISYAHKDEAKVKSFHEGMKLAGIDHFFDRKYLKAGDIFPQVIKDYINSADLFVLFWSENAAKSDYVKKERTQALLRAFPQVKPQEMAKLSIYPMSIEPHADLPDDMKDNYHFGEM